MTPLRRSEGGSLFTEHWFLWILTKSERSFSKIFVYIPEPEFPYGW